MSRGKQSVRKGFWYIGGKHKKSTKKKETKGRCNSFWTISISCCSYFKRVAKAIFGKILGRGRRRRIRRW